jgi:hypothetical protein
MPIPVNFRDAKNILSLRLLQPRKLSGVHGVGVGKVGANVFHLRIYVTDLNADGLSQMLSFHLQLNGAGFPPLPSFTLGPGFADQFPGKPWLKDVVVDVIQAPRAKFGGGNLPTPPPENLERSGDCKSLVGLNPFPAGLSVWKDSSKEVGTIGFFCKDGQSPANKYLVSCNHVLAGSPSSNFTAAVGTRILRHGPSSKPPTWIGKLHEFVPLNSIDSGDFPQTAWDPSLVNRADVAVALMNPRMNNDNKQAKLEISPWVVGPVKMPGTFLAPDIGVAVTKHGFASCTTEGLIDDSLCDFAVLNTADPQREFLFVDQFRIIRPHPNDPSKFIRFAKEGDSGALVYNVKTTTTATINKAVGLLFAIGNRSESMSPQDILEHSGEIDYALATPMTTVLNELNDKIVPPSSTVSVKKKLTLIPSA